MRAERVGAVVAACLLSACNGTIGSSAGRLPGGHGTVHAGEFAPAPGTLHRLTVAEYRATLQDLFGGGVTVPTDLEVDTPLHGFASVGASELTISPRAAEQYEAAALAVAAEALAPSGSRESFVGCAPTGAGDECVRAFLRRFGRRAWRRPLADPEVEVLTTVAATAQDQFGDPWRGVEYALAAILMSPDFLFRVEIGEPDPDEADGFRYSSLEMASRLSYLLWGTTPDDELLDAGERGELVTDDGVRTQAERLLASPRARTHAIRFWSEFLALDRLDVLQKDPAVFPQMSPTLAASMRGEIEAMFDDVVFERDADLRELLTSSTAFVNDELADLYGMPAPARLGFVATASPPERAGLLTTAGMLALYAHNTVTSPTLRGKFVRVNLLCQDIPPPPEGVVTDLEVTGGGDGPRTMRQKLEKHRENPTCAGCHSKMDPIGLALEHFDAIGAWRDTDQGLALDTTAEIDGVQFDGAIDLGEVVAAHPDFGPCVARRFFRRAAGHLETESELPAMDELGEAFDEAGRHFKDLVMTVVMSDAFRRAAPPVEEDP